jgi:3-isopropylmalate/(R)-2-methylmalate dehydratase small subunit
MWTNKKTGRAHVYGDHIDTDRIIPGKYTKTLDAQMLADHVLEDLDPDFRKKLVIGDILVAGENFGCGSSREQAPIALQKAGISLIIAKYFARIFFRNAINIGLPVLEIPSVKIASGDMLEVDLEQGEVMNLTNGECFHASPLPPFMLQILREGGLVRYMQTHGKNAFQEKG